MAYAPAAQGMYNFGDDGQMSYTLFNPHRYGAYGGQWAQGVDAPFRQNFGSSMATMGNLGNMVGGAFTTNAAMNSANRQAMAPYALESKKLDMLQPLLSQALSAAFGAGGGGNTYKDRHSRQGVY